MWLCSFKALADADDDDNDDDDLLTERKKSEAEQVMNEAVQGFSTSTSENTNSQLENQIPIYKPIH